MKKIILILLLAIFNLSCSQNNGEVYKKELSEIKSYVENAYKKDSTKIKAYVKNEINGKIFPIKSYDIYSEFYDRGFDFDNATGYTFIRNNEKIIYARKTPH